jgi:hypothetical protein
MLTRFTHGNVTIKLFGQDGYNFSYEVEARIGALMERYPAVFCPTA